MAITDALANDFEQAWRSRTGHAVGIRGGGSAYQHSPAYDAVVARCVHIRTPVPYYATRIPPICQGLAVDVTRLCGVA
jgi:hypothetical protein